MQLMRIETIYFLFIFYFLYPVNSIVANQKDYPACPINFNPKYYCCDHLDGSKYVYTLYTRPYGADFAEDYKLNWEESIRQVNYPYYRHTPNTPKFKYGDPEMSCHVESKIINENGKKVLQKTLNCSKNSGLDRTLFMTYPGNPRNNNATCPDGALFYSLMLNGSNSEVNQTAMALCSGSKSSPPPKFSTYKEPPFIISYCLYIIAAISGIVWFYIRSSQSLDSQQEDKISNVFSSKLVDSPTTLAISNESMTFHGVSIARSVCEANLIKKSDNIEQLGYKDSLFGKILFYYLVFLTILLNIFIIILIIDMNGGFGDAGLFGKMTPILSALIIIYLFTYCWLCLCIVFQDKLSNFFRRPSSLRNCDWVEMFKPGDSEILLTDYSGISNILESFMKFFCVPSKNGFTETVKVRYTKEGRHYVEFQNLRYMYDPNLKRFSPTTVDMPVTFSDIYDCSNGLSRAEYDYRLELIGPNAIEIKMPSILVSIAKEVGSFIYIYQLMGYYIWFFYGYWSMAFFMVIIIIGSATTNIYYKRAMQSSIVKMSKFSCFLHVHRDHQWMNVSSQDLVPGDLVRVEENMTLPCDMVIVKGVTLCDECMLTGESMPVQKFPIPEGSKANYEVFGSGKKHTLFSGTKVLSSGRNEEILAIVQTTGAHTSKGQLIQTILFPIPMKFKYDEHLKVVLIALLLYALIACAICVQMVIANGNLANYLDIFNYVMYSIVGIVSPLIPVLITVAQINAANRLKEMGIFCLNSQRITLAGKVRVFCFDKTGTITKEGLDYLGCSPIDFESKEFKTIVPPLKLHPDLEPLMSFSLACCHSLGSLNGEIIGNQVELKMFQGSGWNLIEKEGELPIVESVQGKRLQILKRFEFDHHRMSMSVVVRDMQTNKAFVFCKGSYEKIKFISNVKSLPENYDQRSEQLAKEGCYVLGMAYKEISMLKENEMNLILRDRDALELGLSFLGLILFRNEIKDDSKDAIQKLRLGDIRTVMITGDNAMTGCYVAKQCDMIQDDKKVLVGDIINKNLSNKTGLQWTDIDTCETFTLDEVYKMIKSGNEDDLELAVTGKAYDHLVSMGLIKDLLKYIRIFSRMTPDGKVSCVQYHIEAGAVTGMCGDGGNDCGALRQAHVGVALSDLEASIVSPFTSKSKTLTSVVDLCREGRCSVATSFAGVKFLVIYGLISSSLRFIMFYNSILMSEWFFVYADSLTSLGLTAFITRSRPLETLGNRRPTSSLIGPTTLFSLLGQMLINVTFLTLALKHLTHQRWYCPFNPGSVDLSKWWELAENAMGTCVAFIIIFQQQTSAFTFSFGSHYRQPVWKNYGLISLYIILVGIDLFLVLGSPNWFSDLLTVATGTNVVGLPDITLPLKFRQEFLFFLFGNFIISVLFEHFIILGPVRDFFHKRYHKNRLDIKL